jgi:hypothetical protein
MRGGLLFIDMGARKYLQELRARDFYDISGTFDRSPQKFLRLGSKPGNRVPLLFWS